uniref:Uncharacterized protein n=1 Tax=Setaria viridis TaxID=4556 RepID=A0A4U6TES6_SETVI|nr:hypothetical protein SEVIR_8G129800v2 [Setaria viridis]
MFASQGHGGLKEPSGQWPVHTVGWAAAPEVVRSNSAEICVN